MKKKFGKLKTLAIATALTAVAVAGSIAVAQSVQSDQDQNKAPREWRGRRQKGFGGMMGGRLFSQLNLTDDQKAKIQQIHQTFAESNKPLQEQLRAKRQELRQTSEGGTFNEALASQKLTEMSSLQAKLMGERHKLHQEVLSVLTAEQKAQLEQAKAEFKTRRANRPKRGQRRAIQ
jgi:Spy/CpxP family protein refolding chaperone